MLVDEACLVRNWVALEMLLDRRFMVLLSDGGAYLAGVKNADFKLEVDTFAFGFTIGSIRVFDLLPDLLDTVFSSPDLLADRLDPELSSPDLLADLLDPELSNPDLLPELFKVLSLGLVSGVIGSLDSSISSSLTVNWDSSSASIY